MAFGLFQFLIRVAYYTSCERGLEYYKNINSQDLPITDIIVQYPKPALKESPRSSPDYKSVIIL